MTASKQNHIYVYDEDLNKIILINGETGEKIEENDDDVTSILKFLRERGKKKKLRKFALWCADQSNRKIKPIQRKLIELAEKAIEGKATKKQLQELYEETEGTAIATDTVGLRQGSEKAPAFLATRECINPDPYDGAVQAARFHRLWEDMKSRGKEEKTALKEIKVDTSSNRVNSTTQKQINFLLDLIGEEKETVNL